MFSINLSGGDVEYTQKHFTPKSLYSLLPLNKTSLSSVSQKTTDQLQNIRIKEHGTHQFI